jgi:hypothetical protein
MRRSSRPRQVWEVGQTVQVGFMILTVTGFTPATGDGLPGSWQLTTCTGDKHYQFTPYNGLERVS